jgi:hypothetical protein
MKVVYQIWEPDQGFEDLQARIYTEASGLPATAEQIRERNLTRAPKTTRYVLTEEGEPLAYVTARDSNFLIGRTYIGYPWALPDCPPSAQEKIFDELFDYLQNRENTSEITTTIVLNSKMAEQQIQFFEKKRFVKKQYFCRYNLDFSLTEVAKWKEPKDLSTLSSRQATHKDLDLLVELATADLLLSGSLPTKEARRNYFKNRVLKDCHTVLIFDKEKSVAASAVLKLKPDGFYVSGTEERVIMRFSAIRPGYDYVWKKLLIELAKIAEKEGWTDIPFQVNMFVFSYGLTAVHLAEFSPNLEILELLMAYPETKT